MAAINSRNYVNSGDFMKKETEVETEPPDTGITLETP